MSIPAADPGARRVLNFSGAQRYKVRFPTSASNFSDGNNGSWESGGQSRNMKEQRRSHEVDGEGGDENVKGSLPEEVTQELSKGVQKMAVDTGIPDLNYQPGDPNTDGRGCVSGLNSFVDSSWGSRNTKDEQEEAIARSSPSHKRPKLGREGDRKPSNPNAGEAMDIEQKGTKRGLNPSIAESIEDLKRQGLIIEELRQKKGGYAEATATDAAKESPAKKSKAAQGDKDNLTGAHGDSRQGQ
ncbi:unnamed protein product [Urochloa humidicola]